MRDNLSEVLEGGVEGHFWVEALLTLILLCQIERINKVRCSFSLGVGRGDERGELVVADVLVSRQLDEVEQRLLLVDVREEGHKLGVGILSLG